MQMMYQCYLKCLLNSHAPIKLPHNEETIVGRSRITKIKDQSCSRQQISLIANCEECVVEIKQLGINPSGLEGFSLKKDGVYKVKHGSKIEILLNNYFHVIDFDPSPEGTSKQSVKRKLEEEDELSPRKIKSLKTEMDEVSSSIIEASEDVWDDIERGEMYIFTAKGVKSSSKIAAFDMDGTLIKTKSGKVHPVDTNDWQIIFPEVASKLKEYLNNGFKLVILSNQAPIGNGRVKIEDFKKKIENIVLKLKVPIQAYIATGKSIFRKPTTGMWKVLKEQKNDGLEIDMDQSFYCGDAAGRATNWAPGKKKDHSMADKLMAENLGLKFYTPEQFFKGHSIANVPMNKPEFISKEVQAEPFNDKLISGEQEILVLVGFPGSGKSFVAKQIEKKSGYQYKAVCRDVLGSWQKCAAEAKKLLQVVGVGVDSPLPLFRVFGQSSKLLKKPHDEKALREMELKEHNFGPYQGKSVIVDSTNPDVESRGRWTSLAKEMKVECRCAKMATTKAHALHNNKFRELMKINHVPVNDIVFHTYKNKFVEPTPSEGFKEVVEVKFNPCFDDKEAETLYKMHLLEK